MSGTSSDDGAARPRPEVEGQHPVAREGRSPPASGPAPIVAIGASAGGVEALKQLLRALPAGANLSIVVVQHLSPTHESLLTSALTAASPLPVLEVTDGMQVGVGRVHVIPPNTALVLEGHRLGLHPRDAPARPPLP